MNLRLKATFASTAFVLSLFAASAGFASETSTKQNFCAVYYVGKLKTMPSLTNALNVLSDTSYLVESISVQTSQDCLDIAKERHSKMLGKTNIDIQVTWPGEAAHPSKPFSGPYTLTENLRSVNKIVIKFWNSHENMSVTLK